MTAFPVRPHDETVELSLGDKIHGTYAECRRKQPVPRRRRAAALDMAQNRDPRFRAGRLLYQLAHTLTDTAKTEPAIAATAADGLSIRQMCRFGDDHKREVPAVLPHIQNLAGQAFGRPRDFRHQDRIGAA